MRVLGAGRVEQRSNGGYWAQGVCRGQSSNREPPEVYEGVRGIEGRAAAENRLESGKGKEETVRDRTEAGRTEEETPEFRI